MNPTREEIFACRTMNDFARTRWTCAHRFWLWPVAVGEVAAVAILLLSSSAFSDTFGGGAFEIDFVSIGNLGNAADDTGYGSVGYDYRICQHEVSEPMIGAYNAQSGGPIITLDSRGPNRPATSVSWNEAARFVNWLNASRGYPPAYHFTTGGANDDITLWTPADAGYDPGNPFRNSNAQYFLPSEDEWYKAAYYDPNAIGGSGGYWIYATGSDTAPVSVTGGTLAGTAVYALPEADGPADVDSAGGLSPYGTMGQNGNANEWMESGAGVESHTIRGGNWVYNPHGSTAPLRSGSRGGNPPTHENYRLGFRVASFPEPSTYSLSGTAENGSIDGLGDYEPDSTATITALPDSGYIFVEWTGDADGNESPTTVSMEWNKTVGAVFAPDTADDDGDGLSNYQELVVYGTRPDLPDTDGDNYLDGYEVNTGHSPTDPSDKPDLVANIATAVEYWFPTELGKSYRIEVSTSLQQWVLVEGGITGTGGEIRRFYTTRGAGERHFRVEEESAP